MTLTENYESNIQLALKNLIDLKSKRDHKNFTIYQLAKAIAMPHSMLVKLIHVDPTKRVNNPRIDTLTRIVEFFRQDGFDITIDDLLTGFKSTTAVNVFEQTVGAFVIDKTIPIYSMSEGLDHSIGMIDIRLTTDSDSIIALLSDEDIKPIFKKGSIFIVDPLLNPEQDTLVAVKDISHNKILIRKFYIEKHKKILKFYDKKIMPIEITSTRNYQIIGVVIQVNART